MVEDCAPFFSIRRSRLFSTRAPSAGSGTRISAASRDMRAQWRSKANSTPSDTLIVLNTPQPESRPTCPGDSTLSDARRISSLWRIYRCMRVFILRRSSLQRHGVLLDITIQLGCIRADVVKLLGCGQPVFPSQLDIALEHEPLDVFPVRRLIVRAKQGQA